MIRLVLLCLAVLAAQPVRAQVAVVTSGEHDGYSRLLIALPGGDDWQLTRTPGGYALVLPGARGFDLDRAFDRIPRDLVAALTADPDDARLIIDVACACHAIGFRHDAQHLVIDIRDGAPATRSAFELSAEGERLPALSAAAPLPAARTVPRAPVAKRAPVATGPAYDWVASLRSPPPPLSGVPAIVTAPAREGADPVTATAAVDDDLRAALIAEISRGAAAGVIGMAIPEGDRVAVPGGMRIVADPSTGVALVPNTETSPALTDAGSTCPPGPQFDIGTWATDEAYLDQLAHHRAALVGEFDRPDPAAVNAAVRFYLHLGFGAEARDLLQAFPDSIDGAETLAVMADIVEEAPVDPGPLAGWTGCDTSAALWATLALPPERVGNADIGILRQSFGMLPPHLRTLLAPHMKDRAEAMGSLELATAVAAAAGRGQPAARGDAPTSAAALLTSWRDGGPNAIPSALSYVSAAFATRAAVPAEVPGALLSLAEEHADLPDGPALANAARLAAAMAGDFDTGFADPGFVRASPDLWTLLVEFPDDDTFIRAAVGHRDAFPEDHPALASAIAGRLVGLSLPELALDWLPPAPPVPPETALVAAEALVELGRGDAALTWLEGLTDPDAAALRARAADLAGRYDLAALAWAEAGDDQRAGRSARLAGSLTPASAGTAWMRLNAELDGASRPLPDEATGQLQTAGALVSASERLRADITELLDSTEVPSAP